MNSFGIDVFYCGCKEDCEVWQATLKTQDGEKVDRAKWLHGVGNSIPAALTDLGHQLQQVSDDELALKEGEKVAN